MKRIAVIGIVGVPAKYGGFETLVDNLIGVNCSKDIEYTIYCSRKNYVAKYKTYKGAILRYISLKANGVQSVLYDIVAIISSLRHYDILLILGVSGCIILPLIKWACKGRIIVNVDGLEHQRDKWNSYVKWFLKLSEKIAVKYADIIITDNKAIQDYVMKEYRRPSEMIAYGGDHVQCSIYSIEIDILAKYNLLGNSYSFSLCRIEPENNVHIILEAFARSNQKLIFVGNWNNSEYGKSLLLKFSKYSNLNLINPIYDVAILNVFRSNCLFYLHGHSAGGTNPSLVEAMFFKKPILAFDCIYNRESTDNKACYFVNTDQLLHLLSTPIIKFHNNAQAMFEIAEQRYLWKTITSQYENLY